MLRRLEGLINELELHDAKERDRLLGLIVGDLAGLRCARQELERIAATDPCVRTAALQFLESLQALRTAEREAIADARFVELAGSACGNNTTSGRT